MAENDSAIDESLRKDAVADLVHLSGDAGTGVYVLSDLAAADGLRTWAEMALRDESVDLADPKVLQRLLRELDRYARANPTRARSVGKGQKFTVTEAVQAVGWMICLDSSRGSGTGLESRRDDAVNTTKISRRELYPTRVSEHRLFDTYLDYLRETLSDEGTRKEVLPSEDVTSSPWWRNHRRVLIGAIVVVLVFAAGAAVVLWPHRDESRNPYAMTLDERARFDNKDARGYDSPDSKCADPPPSDRLGDTSPTVVGPNGDAVAIIQLRTSAICPSVVWARVVWGGDPNRLFQIPDGWTLHTVLHRPSTSTTIEALDQSSAGTPVQYGLSKMLTTEGRHCVYAEAYFSNGATTTTPSTTSCMLAAQ